MTETYNPKLGDANRYENALYHNKNLAEEIDKEASKIVSRGEKLLKKVQENPQLRYCHDPITRAWGSGETINDFLMNQVKKIHDLYGITGIEPLNDLSGVPKDNVLPFLIGVHQTLIFPEWKAYSRGGKH